ncbi:hypothetical protein E1189_00785 [Sansalvadorimonas verongulae]|nr:hypothetical protein [Sansalvadorimonas verongulae]
MKKIIIASIALFLTACGRDNPEQYFQDNRSGNNSDFGIYKWGYDHVATVHGFTDDKHACEMMAKALEIDGGKFICKPIN